MTELEQHLMEQNKALLEQVRQLTEQIQYLNKKLFGSSSEKTKVAEGQISLFDPDDFLKRQRQLKTKPSKKSRIDVKNKKEEKQN
ncbi:transposase [Turicibacter sp. TJ11]|uniref:transposase n=1 Tax=Turicibacter sp. TJ11 TaxID=2806443 RepID=UPI001F484810|nr:transposase [Turicibacter sp. TJ11]